MKRRSSTMKRRLSTTALPFAAAILSLAVAAGAESAMRPDAWVTTKVKLSLMTSDGVSASAVNVDTIDGRVTLHGWVPTAAEKASAEQVAKQVDGVREVRNLLQVLPRANDARVSASDDQLAESVAAALKADTALRGSGIRVQSVNQGVVLLTGKARTLSDTYRAVDTAAGVPGVRRVASEIQSPDLLADEELWPDGAYDAAAYEASSARDLWITTAAKVRLLANSETPGFEINVDTENRSVTLFGLVPSASAKQAAEAEVRKVDGVRNVVNDLQVVAEAQQDRVEATDADLAKTIESRIAAHAIPEEDIDVAVSNGVARLSGTVKTRRDQLTALTVARTTTGVKKVIDDLRLEAPEVSAR